MSARITACYKAGSRQGRPGWRISFHYNETAVALLKKMIPVADREWGDLSKEWWIAEEHKETLREIFPGVCVYMDQPSLL